MSFRIGNLKFLNFTSPDKDNVPEERSEFS